MAGDKQYQPIQCEIHDGYELACMRKAIHDLQWQDEQGKQQVRLRFLDLEYTKAGEFLIAEDQSGKQFRIRLDSILSKLPY